MTKSLVRKRDLRTGRSYWFSRRAPRVASSPLSGDIKTDILIVGAGVSGAFLADALSRKAGVVVVDRRGVMKGSTPASTARSTRRCSNLASRSERMMRPEHGAARVSPWKAFQPEPGPSASIAIWSAATIFILPGMSSIRTGWMRSWKRVARPASKVSW